MTPSRASCHRLVHGLLHAAGPRSADLVLEFTETKCPSNPLGIKGCGEAGAIAAPAAVINAITDALGVKDLAMPATSQTVWRRFRPRRPGKRPNKDKGGGLPCKTSTITARPRSPMR
jgi:hypothetical protein